jgi:hypothetical protein
MPQDSNDLCLERHGEEIPYALSNQNLEIHIKLAVVGILVEKSSRTISHYSINLCLFGTSMRIDTIDIRETRILVALPASYVGGKHVKIQANDFSLLPDI